jgi:hypothetical protein
MLFAFRGSQLYDYNILSIKMYKAVRREGFKHVLLFSDITLGRTHKEKHQTRPVH